MRTLRSFAPPGRRGHLHHNVCRRASCTRSSDGFADLAEAVFSFDLVFSQATDAREGTAAIGHSNGDHDLVGAGSVVEADLHAVEVAANESSIFVAEGNVEDDAKAAAFLVGGDEGGAFAENASHRRPE